ncbi:MAG: serine hydrolase [Xanthomonadales bacterium]|nr:serine hydrolase [Xanthomonadales bacterium]
MIVNRTFVIALLATLAVSHAAIAQPESDALDALVRQGMADWHVPGMAVAVTGPDRVLFSRGYGRTGDGGPPVDEHTLFAIASTTKAMVAAGVLMLQDEGLLKLDDLAVDHLQELQFKPSWVTREITVRDLLTHRTGLASTDFMRFFQDMPLNEQLPRLRHVSPSASPRARFQYQNTMYVLAGEVIARVSGKPWPEFLRERLWQPVGMRETFASRAEFVGSDLRRVRPHLYLDGEIVVAQWDLPDDRYSAAGSVWSTLHDLTLWTQFLLRGGVTADGTRLLSEDAYAEMFRPQMLVDEEAFYPTLRLTRPQWMSYGLGWFQQDFQGRRVDFHTGSLSGLIALIGLDRAGGLGVIVLGNQDHAELRHAVLWHVMDDGVTPPRRDWGRDILRLYAETRREDAEQWARLSAARDTESVPSLPLDGYTGRYHNPAYGTLEVARGGDALELRSARITMRLSHWEGDTFLAEWPEWELRQTVPFELDGAGRARAFEAFGARFVRSIGPERLPAGD